MYKHLNKLALVKKVLFHELCEKHGKQCYVVESFCLDYNMKFRKIVNLSSYLCFNKMYCKLTIDGKADDAHVCLSGRSDAVVSGRLQLFKSCHISPKIFNEWFLH